MHSAKQKKSVEKFPFKSNIYNKLWIVVIFISLSGCDYFSISDSQSSDNMSATVLLKKNPDKNRTTEQVVNTCLDKTASRYKAILEQKGMAFPPPNLQLLAFKEEQKLEVYANKKWLHTYRFKAYSGKRGPKQREGDRQIPEGIYQVEHLNPNSQFHISFKINYPNERDKKRATLAGIQNPGTDIFIHGKQVSVGCIPIGDAYIEELYTLVALAGEKNVQVIIFPNDARKLGKFLPCEVCPPDVNELYEELKAELAKY